MQLFVRSLHSGCIPVQISAEATIDELKQHIEILSGVPVCLQRLRCGRHDISQGRVNSLSPDSIVHLLLRLVGGKGGFGSLLRVQGRDTKATTNFDACRDLSGRRMRHVNATKKLEEWEKGAEDRALEEVALKHLNEEVKRRRKELRQTIDPSMVLTLQKEMINKVKDAVQNATQSNKVQNNQQCKKPRYHYQDSSSSSDDDSGNESLDKSFKELKASKELLQQQDSPKEVSQGQDSPKRVSQGQDSPEAVSHGQDLLGKRKRPHVEN